MCGGGAGGGEDWNGGEWRRGREQSTAGIAAPDRSEWYSGVGVKPDAEAVKRDSPAEWRHSVKLRRGDSGCRLSRARDCAGSGDELLQIGGG